MIANVAQKREIENYKILENLPYADGAGYCDLGQQAVECLHNTRREVLKKIMGWLDDPGDPTFWLQGMAGTGKSSIARTIAELAKHHFAVGSFFFQRGSNYRGKPDSFITTLVRQLSCHDELLEIFANAVRSNFGIEKMNLDMQWQKLIQQPRRKIQGSSRILVVVDALDECENKENDATARQTLFDILSGNRADRIQGLKIFVTSRPEVWMPPVCGTRALDQIGEKTVARDIRLFLETKFDEFRTHHKSKWPGRGDVEKLVKQSIPSFIVAATSFRFIADHRTDPKRRFNILCSSMGGSRSTPPDFDRMYLSILKYAVTCDGDDHDSIQETLDRFSVIFGPLMALQGALSPIDFAKLVSEEDSEDYSPVKNFLGAFKAVLDVPDGQGPLRVSHPSFRDFLMTKERLKKALTLEGQVSQPILNFEFKSEDFWISENDANISLFKNCLRVMESLRENICDLGSPGTAVLDIQNLDSRIPVYLHYACRYWSIHFLRIRLEEKNMQQTLLEFLQKHFLHWIEIMSCLKSLSEAARQIDQLVRTLQVRNFKLN